jgi:hypothetical protein
MADYKGKNIPQDLRKIDEQDIIDLITYFSSLPLKELRRRQNINEQQQERAYEKKLDKAIINCEINFELLRCSVDYKEFGKKEGEKPEDYVGDVLDTIESLK